MVPSRSHAFSSPEKAWLREANIMAGRARNISHGGSRDFSVQVRCVGLEERTFNSFSAYSTPRPSTMAVQDLSIEHSNILVCAVRNDCFLILSFASCKAHVYIQHHARMHAGAIIYTADSTDVRSPISTSCTRGSVTTFPRYSTRVFPARSVSPGVSPRVAAGFGDQLARCPRELRPGTLKRIPQLCYSFPVCATPIEN